MQDFRGLDVWERSHQVALSAYRATDALPECERFGLRSQLRRCSTSILTNIAGGCGRGSDADSRRFLLQAMGSASEFEYLLLLSEDLQMLAPDQARPMMHETQRVKTMLASFIRRLGAHRRT